MVMADASQYALPRVVLSLPSFMHACVGRDSPSVQALRGAMGGLDEVSGTVLSNVVSKGSHDVDG